jgi:hypothetical protein
MQQMPDLLSIARRGPWLPRRSWIEPLGVRAPDGCSAALAYFERKGLTLIRATSITSLFALFVGFSGCAVVPDAVSDSMTDPAKYDLYDCKQL